MCSISAWQDKYLIRRNGFAPSSHGKGDRVGESNALVCFKEINAGLKHTNTNTDTHTHTHTNKYILFII